ncbi:hypothetical protein BDZ91DRAFT_766088 [Kalaharituber pfeilii]|nr:hypothetical protein BDZ91DRAFT_766088 [Kalaharituber pfeilii]
MAVQSALLGPTTRRLKILEDNYTLVGEFRQDDGEWVSKEIKLTSVMDIHEDDFKWSPCSDVTKWETSVAAASIHNTTLIATLATSRRIIYVDLGLYIFNVCGEPRYIPDPVVIPNPDFGFIDGNINASAWAVASDSAMDRCRIAYRTYIEDKVSLAEVKFEKGHWSISSEIELYAGKVPKQNFAFAYDPNDSKKRSLFFSPENGDGYIYQQEYDPVCRVWQEPHFLRGHDIRGRGNTEGPKAHRFSKFAATHYNPKISACDPSSEEHLTGMILLYYVDESNGLQEIVGTRKSTGEYGWTRTTLLEQEVLPNGFMAVAQKGNTTYVLFRNAERALCLAIGKRKESALKADWQNTVVLRDPHQIGKNSPVAMATRQTEKGDEMITVFYLLRQGTYKFIFALDYKPDEDHSCRCSAKRPRRVGKLEPGSILGAASFQNNKDDARLFSVSNLDGDTVLLERVPRKAATCAGGPVFEYWEMPSGIVDTDVDHL